MASGGGGTQEQTATQITELPDWAKPYAKETLAKTQELTSQPYQTYGGERIAGFTPMQQQAQQAAGAMQVAPQIGAATGMAGTAGLGSLMAGQQYGQMATDPGSMQAYMSPYMQNVVDIQKREAQRQADIAATQRGSQAVKSGAFGGTRAQFADIEANRNLAQQMGDIQAKGSQAAFEQARQAQQFGAELGLRGLGQAGQMASTLGQLGQTQFAQEQGIINLQRDVGKEQQALRQAGYDIGYQDFLRQQQYPYQQLGFMADMIRGVPVGQTAQTIYQQPGASPLSQLLGAGTAAYGAYKTFGAAEGGSVPGYADGGIASFVEGGGIGSLNPVELDTVADKLSDAQIDKSIKPNVVSYANMILQQEKADRANLRGLAAAANQQPQPQMTVVQEDAMERGLPALALADDAVVSAAEGGIIGFRAAGEVPAPRVIPGADAPTGGQVMAKRELDEQARAAIAEAQRTGDRAAVEAVFKKLSEIGYDVAAFLPRMAQGAIENLPKPVLSNTRLGGAFGLASESSPPAGIAALPEAAAATPAQPAVPYKPVSQEDYERMKAGAEQAEGVAPSVAKPTEPAEPAKPAGPALSPASILPPETNYAAVLKPLEDQMKAADKSVMDAAAMPIEIARDNLSALQQQIKDEGVYGEEEMKRLSERSAKLDKDEKQNFGFAIMMAGLTTMGGKDPNAFANIAAGMTAGLTEYKKGADKIYDRRMDIEKAQNDINKYRRLEGRENKRLLLSAQTDLKKAGAGYAKTMSDYYVNKLGMNRDLAVKQAQADADRAMGIYEQRMQTERQVMQGQTQRDVAKIGAEQSANEARLSREEARRTALSKALTTDKTIQSLEEQIAQRTSRLGVIEDKDKKADAQKTIDKLKAQLKEREAKIRSVYKREGFGELVTVPQ